MNLYKVDPSKYELLPHWSKGIGSLLPRFHKKSFISKEFIIKEKVKADTLMNILKKNEQVKSDVDLLQVDAEGFDFEVIKLIDFEKIHPRIIKFEYANLNLFEKRKSVDILKRNGYTCILEGEDMLAIDLRKVKI